MQDIYVTILANVKKAVLVCLVRFGGQHLQA